MGLEATGLQLLFTTKIPYFFRFFFRSKVICRPCKPEIPAAGSTEAPKENDGHVVLAVVIVLIVVAVVAIIALVFATYRSENWTEKIC